MKPHLSIPDRGSRFVQRWLAAKPEHAQELERLCAVPLAEVSFESLLQAQLGLGITLPAAMRRCRNLLFSTLAVRDISGTTDLNQVLYSISAFADFAVQTHLAARHAE
jgi:glutamate-ammonia-ligase adenylyltransferase